MNEEFVPRNFCTVADQIIDIIRRDCTFSTSRVNDIVNRIEKCKYDSGFRAPELQYMCWCDLSDILSEEFVPSNSRWETEIMFIFNDLSGTVDDYWDPEES